MTQSSLAIANWFISKANEVGKPISPMKLMKLVYYAHGWYLGNLGEPLLNETVEAWQYGPVIPSIYRQFKSYGNKDIKELGTLIKEGEQINPLPNEQVVPLLEKIWDAYSGFTAVQLSNMTHAPDEPWSKVIKDNQGSLLMGLDIPNTAIKDHFAKLISKV